jgi:hypothetical protein
MLTREPVGYGREKPDVIVNAPPISDTVCEGFREDRIRVEGKVGTVLFESADR